MKLKNNTSSIQHITTVKKDIFVKPGDDVSVDENTIRRPELGRVKKVFTVIDEEKKEKSASKPKEKKEEKPKGKMFGSSEKEDK